MDCEGLDVYLSEQGAARVPSDRRGCAEAAIATFLGCVFADRSEFGFEPVHFEAAYADLEHALYEGHCTATVIAPVLGLALDPTTTDLPLGDGLSLIRGDALRDAPAEAVWGDGDEPNVLALLAVDQERVGAPTGVGGAGPLPPHPHRAAAVRARRVRDRARSPGRGPRPEAGGRSRSGRAADRGC